jgi:beta-lactamase regulating signal transducer with metallopeptidase domain
VVALWLVGVVAVGAVLVGRRRRYGRVIRAAEPVRDVRARAVAEAWREKFGVRRSVRLVTSGELSTPFTSGSVRPVIYLPEAALRHEDSAVVESVIGHEMAHIKRWDDLQLILQLSAFARRSGACDLRPLHRRGGEARLSERGGPDAGVE